jgi:hypothetical protein
MQLATKINSLIRNDEILDAQDDRHYGKTNRPSDLPDELRRRQVRLERFTMPAEFRQQHRRQHRSNQRLVRSMAVVRV